MTINEKRNVVVRSSLTNEAINALKSCLEPPTFKDGETTKNGSSQKEIVVRSLLASEWVQKFQMNHPLTENSISLIDERAHCILKYEDSFKQDMNRDSSEIEKSFQKSLNSSFEGTSSQLIIPKKQFSNRYSFIFDLVATEYLEKQRRWAETGAVRDLEFEGDTRLKTLSGMCKRDRKNVSKDLAELSAAANLRWKAINKRSGNIWESSLNWRLSNFTDISGRRVLLVPNLEFDSHESARYDLMLGHGHDRDEKESKQRALQSQLSDLMKRNSEALTSYDEILALEGDHEDDKKLRMETKEDDDDDLERGENELLRSESFSVESFVTDVTDEESISKELNNDGDEWAKNFIWQDEESIVAR